jgi:hypothetical protein
VALLAVVGFACGDDDDGGDDTGGETNAPSATLTGNAALDVYIREAVKSNWFALGDDIEFETEELLWEDALVRSQEVGLPIYATEPGDPPYEDGLPGTLIIASGDFYDYTGPPNETPSPETPRREAQSIAFVDEQGRISYAFRFTDGQPPSTPAPTAAPE